VFSVWFVSIGTHKCALRAKASVTGTGLFCQSVSAYLLGLLMGFGVSIRSRRAA
jgi:hypothetical protein